MSLDSPLFDDDKCREILGYILEDSVNYINKIKNLEEETSKNILKKGKNERKIAQINNILDSLDKVFKQIYEYRNILKSELNLN